MATFSFPRYLLYWLAWKHWVWLSPFVQVLWPMEHVCPHGSLCLLLILASCPRSNSSNSHNSQQSRPTNKQRPLTFLSMAEKEQFVFGRTVRACYGRGLDLCFNWRQRSVFQELVSADKMPFLLSHICEPVFLRCWLGYRALFDKVHSETRKATLAIPGPCQFSM